MLLSANTINFLVCVWSSLDDCHGTVAAEYQGVDAMFEYLCRDGRVGKPWYDIFRYMQVVKSSGFIRMSWHHKNLSRCPVRHVSLEVRKVDIATSITTCFLFQPKNNAINLLLILCCQAVNIQ